MLSGAGLTIVPTFDSTITSDPNAAQIEADINAVIAKYEAAFSDAITVNIIFKSSTDPNVLGLSNTGAIDISYPTLRNALAADQSTANDTLADPAESARPRPHCN